VWLDRFPADVPRALRAATFASEIGAGPRFALAASRLTFCGGFDLDDPETLVEAAAAAGVPLDPCLEAAGDQALAARFRACGRSPTDRAPLATPPAGRLLPWSIPSTGSDPYLRARR
jgi:2-hydroxychromene-2-carboxylate isomerase